MHLSEDYQAFALHRAGERRLQDELELRRRVDERVADATAAAAATGAIPGAESGPEPGDGVTDGARRRRGIRQVLPKRLRPLWPTRPAIGPGAA